MQNFDRTDIRQWFQKRQKKKIARYFVVWAGTNISGTKTNICW